MSKVFITNDAGHDYTPAEEFGELIYMTRGYVPKAQISTMIRKFDEFLKYSSPDDYMLQSGPSILNSIACCLFVAKHSRLNLLIFTGEKYFVRRANFENFKEVKIDRTTPNL